MRTPSLMAIGLALCAVAVSGCQSPAAPLPSSSTSAPVSSPSHELDLTRPGQATAMVKRLAEAARSTQLLQVEITRTEATVSVLLDGTPHTWAWRNQSVQEVQGDILDVDQASFSIDAFNIDDVASLFSQAAAIAGSASNQELQIVDSSAGEVMMSVSSLPESRTVFFYPDGRLLPTLNFASKDGIIAGLADAIGQTSQVTMVGIRNDVGAYVDYPGVAGRTTFRRLRAPAVPTIIIERGDRSTPLLFSPSLVRAEVVWTVLVRELAKGSTGPVHTWSVEVDDRETKGQPRMHFTIGTTQLVTDLAGNPVSSS